MQHRVYVYRVLVYWKGKPSPLGESVIRAHDKKEAEKQAITLWSLYNPKKLVCVTEVIH